MHSTKPVGPYSGDAMGAFDYWVLPLRTFALQGLFLLVAIALEAIVLHNRLGISRRGGVQYALIINLVSTVIGWMAFFTLEPYLSNALELDVMSYVLFNRTLSPTAAMPSLVLIGIFAVYTLTFVVETQAMNVLLRLWGTPPPPAEYGSKQEKSRRQLRYKSSLSGRLRAGALLRANAFSYGAIAILLYVLKQTRFL